VVAGSVGVGCRVAAELVEALRPALVKVGLVVGVEPVADEVPGLGESRVQGRVVVAAAKPPVPPVGGADLQ
jgi:hypothetical protein